ncbi:hypothetical protein D9M72_653270 [compost metagenome]
MFRKEMDNDTDAGRDGTQFAHGPVAQDANDLRMSEQPSINGLPHQAGGDIVRCSSAGLLAYFQL